jgi:hypothetical protein
MIERYVIVENGVVINAVVHDEESGWNPPEGTLLIKTETASIGDMFDGTNFTSPPAPVPTAEQIRASVLQQLIVIDQKSIRPNRSIMSAIAAGQIPDEADVTMLNDLINQAATLRGQL